MKKPIKKLLMLLVTLVLPFTIAGCTETPPVIVEYYLTPTETEFTLNVGETAQILYETNIEDAINFTSFDEKVVTVDENGVIKAKKPGTATIYVNSGICEFEVTVTVLKPVEKTYKIEIYGYDTIETTRQGMSVSILLEQQYGKKGHPEFGNYIFGGYYTDPEFTNRFDTQSPIVQDITLYPRLVKDTVECDLMFSLSDVILFEDDITVNKNVFAISPVYGSTVAYKNETYENCDLIEVRYNYNDATHYITKIYSEGRKQDTKIPYDGFIIVVAKDSSNYSDLKEKLVVGAKISIDRYTINLANRIYVNKKDVIITQDTINPSLVCTYSSVYDYTNKQFLFQKNGDLKAYPASTNKIITALAALQNAPSLEMEITIGDELDYMYQGSDPGTAGSKKGQVWTLRQLLYAMLLKSGNDSAYSVAVGVARSLPGNENKSTWELLEIFAELMNDVKDQVGATNSHFMPAPDGNSYYKAGGSSATPNLWDERLSNQYVTANDMIKFATLGFNYPALAEVVSTASKSFKVVSGESFSFSNTNSLIQKSSDSYYEYAVGMKTGTTTPGGQCLIFGAECDGRFVIGAVLKSSGGNRYNDALAILRAAFKN